MALLNQSPIKRSKFVAVWTRFQVGTNPASHDYSKDLLPEARKWNLARLKEALVAGVSPIVVDRGNGLNAETREFAALAVEHGYIVELAEPPRARVDNSQLDAELATRSHCRRDSLLPRHMKYCGDTGNACNQRCQGRDILIGGSGADRLIGDQDEDILIADHTSWDNNSSTNNFAITSILKKCSSSNSYATRVSKITNGGGLNGRYRLVGDDGVDQTGFNENDVDTLTGSQGIEQEE